AQATVLAAGRRHDENANAAGVGAIAGRDTADARHFRRRLSSQLFEVLHGDSPVAGAKHDRSTNLRVVDRLAIDATFGSAPILDLRDVGDGGLEHGDGIARNIPSAS